MEQDTDVHLRWNNHQTTLLSLFSSLLDNGNLVDCTITAEGQYFKAHRVILSACSPYFELLFSQHYEMHPIVILPDVKFQILKALMEFMYSGEVKVPQNKLSTVLKLAETLQIKGLSLVSDSELKNELKPKRTNEGAILSELQIFTKSQHEPRHCSQVEQKRDGSQSDTLEMECTTETASHSLVTQKSDKHSSNSIAAEKTVEEPALSQDINDTEDFNVFQRSSLTQTPNKLITRVSETLLNPVSNILYSSQLPRSSEDNISERLMSSENLLPTFPSGEVLATSDSLGSCSKRPVVDLPPEIKQEEPDDFDGHSIEEIILDDDIEDGDVDNANTVGGFVRVIPEEHFSEQGFCNVEQYRDIYFVEPASILPSRFRCDACGRSYRYHRGLLRHLKYECGKEPQFQCPHCSFRCYQKCNLKAHMVRHNR